MSLRVWQLEKPADDAGGFGCTGCDRKEAFPTCPLPVRQVCCSSQRADREDRILKKR